MDCQPNYAIGIVESQADRENIAYHPLRANFFHPQVAKRAAFVLWVLKEMDDIAPSDWSSLMTTEQKCLIDQYRKSGMKYSEIARTIGLPETTVKSYCYTPTRALRAPAPSTAKASKQW